ncbi:extracellular solute-binding protein [Paenibacillus sp. 19GGS1-52]|uniref:extracellular solute-binding protein n=1 Tax=Paenibacillus sp. 19GGS1-52 TaxID=2758563 RepID=UPI001EFADAAA|nr:extracellular solute-binding protein [Paenibacillus sp. 19GGS1-52]ULO07698.1 extracellular solute-binding protein [Paenibacillus sp. 19GGS1-52]
MPRFPLTLIVCLLIGSMPLLIAGCEHSSTEVNNLQVGSIQEAPKKDSLVFRITWKTYSGRGEAIRKIVQAYNDQNTSQYEVIMVDGDEDRDVIEDLLDRKNQDQVDVYVLPYRYIKYFGQQGKLLNLTQEFAQEKDLFYEELWNLSMVDKQVYGIPWLGHSMGLIYNQDLLERSGVDPKQINSLENLVSALERVESNTTAKGIGLVGANHHDITWMVNQFIYGFGSSLVNSEGSQVTINNQQSKAALEFYKNVLGKHAQANWTNDSGIEVMDQFREGKVAFEIQGIWGVTDIWKNGNPFEVGVIPLKNVSLKAEVGPMMVAVSPQVDEKKNAAIQFMKYLISVEGQEKVLDGEYSIEHDTYYPFRTPVRKDLVHSRLFENNPVFSTFLEGFNDPSIDVPVPKWEAIKKDLYEEGLHQVMTGELKIDEFLQQMETKGNQILLEP